MTENSGAEDREDREGQEDRKEDEILYPDNMASNTWEYTVQIEGQPITCRCYLITPTSSHYCGYVRFKERPVKEESYGGLLTYVPVHGGLTYSREDQGGMVYGFDCAHLGDEENPWTRNLDWLRDQCQIMAEAILVATKFEDRYLLAEGNNEQRLKTITEYLESLDTELDISNNFGVILNILSGSL